MKNKIIIAILIILLIIFSLINHKYSTELEKAKKEIYRLEGIIVRLKEDMGRKL